MSNSKSRKISPAASHQKRGVIYSRYSTEEQNASSIAGQRAYCQTWLQDNGYGDLKIAFVDDEGISGETLDRPGIKTLESLIRSGKVKLVVAEDVSRFYRDRALPVLLARLCKDHGVRCVGINDRGADTELPGWEEAFVQAGGKHAASNEDTAHRIRRSARIRWNAGHSLGPAHPGYRNVPIDPEEYEWTRKGPFRMEVVPCWKEVITEAFERVARGDPLATVAEFLTSQELPRQHNAKKKEWTVNAVRDVVTNPVYTGVEVYPRSKMVKHYESGKHRQVATTSAEQQRREMPHLQIVSAGLAQRAINAIQSRDRANSHPRGADNPSFGIPRDSRMALSAFVCGICGGKMIGQGRNHGGYRCGNALEGMCWNRATTKRELAHERIFGVVIERLGCLDGAADFLVELVQRHHQEGGDATRQLAQVEDQIEKATQQIDWVMDEAIERLGQVDFQGKLDQLNVKKRELEVTRDELMAVVGDNATPPTREDILERCKEFGPQLLAADREAGLLLRQLTSTIQAVPMQRVDCDLVVLRARFNLTLAGLVPSQWRDALRSLDGDPENVELASETIEVDLFDEPLVVKLAWPAMELKRQGLKAQEIAEKLNTNRKSVYEAIQLAELMEQRQIDEPYVKLASAPASASRWKMPDKAAATITPAAE